MPSCLPCVEPFLAAGQVGKVPGSVSRGGAVPQLVPEATAVLVQCMHGIFLALHSRQEHGFASDYVTPYLKCFAVPNVQVSHSRKRKAGIAAWEQTWGLVHSGLWLHVQVLSSLRPVRACRYVCSYSQAGDAWWRYWFWSALLTLLPAAVARLSSCFYFRQL